MPKEEKINFGTKLITHNLIFSSPFPISKVFLN